VGQIDGFHPPWAIQPEPGGNKQLKAAFYRFCIDATPTTLSHKCLGKNCYLAAAPVHARPLLSSAAIRGGLSLKKLGQLVAGWIHHDAFGIAIRRFTQRVQSDRTLLKKAALVQKELARASLTTAPFVQAATYNSSSSAHEKVGSQRAEASNR
jgi:hypothetical protein